MNQLSIGEMLSLAVDPRALYVPAGIEVAPGQRYRFDATGKWRDWFHVVGPTGWKLWPLQLRNRVPGAAFFCLCGCIGANDHHAFAIGAGCDWVVPDSVAGLADRQLHLFANDWLSRYGNNHALPAEEGGPLQANITRLE